MRADRHSQRGASLVATLVVLVIAGVILVVAWNYRQHRLREMRSAETPVEPAVATYAGVSAADLPRYEAYAFHVRAFKDRFERGVNFDKYDVYLDALYDHFGRLPEVEDEDEEEPELKQAANGVVDACNWVKVRWKKRSGDDDPRLAEEIARARRKIDAFLRIHERVRRELSPADEQ